MPIRWQRTITIAGQEVNEEEYFATHASEHTTAEWQQLLGRTEVAIELKANRLGVRTKRIGDPGNPETKFYRGVKAETILKLLRDRPYSAQELSVLLDRSVDTVRGIVADMQADGYCIASEDGMIQDVPPGPLPRHLVPTLQDRPAGRFAFGVISDTHGGSKFSQYTNLRAFTKLAREKYGVKWVLHAGDITDGQGMYEGQVYEQYAHGVDEQVDDVVQNMPDDVRILLIGGNHDWSHYRAAGVDAAALIARERDNLVYVGSQSQDVPLTETIDIRMWHPRGGVPYALSYRGQKYAAQVAAGELQKIMLTDFQSAVSNDSDDDIKTLLSPSSRIRIILIGHLHVAAWFPVGYMYVFQAGCFQGQTGYLKERGLFPNVGGWVIEVQLADIGIISELTLHWIPFLEIEEDYKNHHVPSRAKALQEQKIGPLFVLKD